MSVAVAMIGIVIMSMCMVVGVAMSMVMTVMVIMAMPVGRRFGRNLDWFPGIAILHPAGEQPKSGKQCQRIKLPPEIPNRQEAKQSDAAGMNLRPKNGHENDNQHQRHPRALGQCRPHLLPVDCQQAKQEPEQIRHNQQKFDKPRGQIQHDDLRLEIVYILRHDRPDRNGRQASAVNQQLVE